MDTQNNMNNAGGNNSAPQMSAEQNKTLWAVLSYLGPLVIISYIMGRGDEFVKFHMKQGLVVLSIEVIAWILGSMFLFFWMIVNLLNIITLILSIIGIVNAVQGKEKKLPVVGSWGNMFKL